MGIWPFRKKKQEEEAYFASTSGASVVPAAPLGEAITPTSTVQPSASQGTQSQSQQQLDAQQAANLQGPPGVPPAVLQLLHSAGIDLDQSSHVHVSTQTTQLSGNDAMQMFGQLGEAFRQMAAAQSSPLGMQVHPGVQIFTNGRLLESTDQLRATGIDGQATVKDLEEKHVVLGELHVVKLKLEVTKPGEAPYEVYTGALVPAKVTEEFAEGKTFKAKIDPNDKQQVLVLWD
jgi:hypothetical protein